MINKFLAAAWVALPFAAAAQTVPLYENRGSVNTPQVDAAALHNLGTFTVSVTQPYETLNTLNYTNAANALMQGGVGFQFSYSTERGRVPAANFINRGSVSAGNTSFNFGDSGISFGGAVALTLPTSYLLISATNVVNAGHLTVTADGLLSIKGDQVNLARGGLRSGDIPGLVTPGMRGTLLGDSLYRPAEGVSEIHAGIGANNNFEGRGSIETSLIQMPAPTSGRHEVLNNLRTNRVTVGSPPNIYAAWAMTNRVTPSNYTHQAVFVATNNPDPNFAVKVKWGRSTDPDATRDARMPIVELSLWDIDAVTGLPATNFIYILDSTAVITNLIYLTNLFSDTILRPSTLEISRSTPLEWRAAAEGNAPFANTLFVSPDFPSTTVTNSYAAYSAQVGSAAAAASGFFGGFYFGGFQDAGFLTSPVLNDPTNLPGRVQIEAKNLDLSLLRLKSDGLLSIKADNVQGSAPTRIDSPQVFFDLSTTNSLLSISNVIPESIRRLDGLVNIYSTVFTNQLLSVMNTNTADPMDPAGFVTNTIDVKCHALIVDPLFSTLRSVGVREVKLKGPSILIADKFSVSGNLIIDSESLTTTTNSLVAMTGDPNLDITNVPRLRNWTNGGPFQVGNAIELVQKDTNGVPLLQNFFNRGTIAATTMSLAGESLESVGVINIGRGPLSFSANSIKLSGGRASSSGDIHLEGADLKIRNVTMQAGALAGINYTLGSLNLKATERLSDGGGDARNNVTVYNGFNLLSSPHEGDLFGTKIRSIAPRYVDVQHVWAGKDRGPGADGFSNNVVIGNLILDGDFNSRFTFRGTSEKNAIYVDFLELANHATNLSTSLNLEPGFKLYFGAANVAVEGLDGAFDGRVQWARSFAGPLSSTNVTLANGQKFTVNKSVFTSATIDSDGDGLVNRVDPSPFDGVRILSAGITNLATATAFIAWNAAPQLEYTVECKSNLSSNQWISLTNVINLEKTNTVVRAFDPNPPSGGAQKFYRVRYNP